jgi:outer membrane protein OmpA-like peptidoglycan-associated protein
MKNFLLAFFVFLLYSIFGMWYHACIIKEVCNGSETESEQIITSDDITSSSENDVSNPATEIKNNAIPSGIKIDDVDFNFPNNLGLKANDISVFFPDGQNDFMESIFNFLNKNQNKELIITGLFNSNEAIINDQIGNQRAGYVKDLLVKFGINENRVSVDSKLADFNYDANQDYIGGILLSFIDISEDKKKAIESGIANKTLYSGFGSKEFSPDNSLRAYALELKNYLNKYPDKKARIIGHTDSVGDNLANDWYGMERAKNVKQYLISQGILESRLIASSKGETEPIASNGTLEGRRKNRRIEIKVN